MTVQAWKDAVAALGCILCRHQGKGYKPACLHHVREGQGMSQRAKDWMIVPLCVEHHTGSGGIHGSGFYWRYKLDELDLLAMTIEAMAGRMP